MRKFCNELTAVVCVYAGADENLFALSLSSILKQTLLPRYIVIAEDGPLNLGHEKVISKFEQECEENEVELVSVKSKENIGHGLIRNMALARCCTKYIAICDADDYSLAHRFEILMPRIRAESSLSVVGSYVLEGNLQDQRASQYIKKVPTESSAIREGLANRCPVNQMSAILNLEHVKKVGGYEDFFHNEDYYLWFKLIEAGFNITNVPEVLVNANVDSSSYSRRGGLEYFLSEFKMQKILYRAHYSGFGQFLILVSIRFLVQVVLPNWARALFYKKLLRKS